MVFHIFPTEVGRIPICKKNTGEVFIESIEFCWQNPHMCIPKSTCLLEKTVKHGSLNVPIEHHPKIRYMVYNGYYKVMSNIPKMGQLPTPVKIGLP